ncbi:MAG: signal peptidase II [Myxococcota bacterium]|nr:signal peptidase II [Myxococcota bacterium]
MNRKYWLFAIVTVLMTVLDQVTKIWVVRNIRYRIDEIEIIPGVLSLVHAQNPGAALGMLNTYEYRMHVFAVFTIIALVVLGQMLMQLPRDDRFQTTALAFITSGAIGNAIDRIDKQSVTDFIRFYTEHPELKPWLIETIGTNEYPSFNVADAAICTGLGLFVIHFLFLQEDTEGLEPDPPSAPLDTGSSTDA